MGTVPLSTIPGHTLVLMGASGEQMVKVRFSTLSTLSIYRCGGIGFKMGGGATRRSNSRCSAPT